MVLKGVKVLFIIDLASCKALMPSKVSGLFNVCEINISKLILVVNKYSNIFLLSLIFYVLIDKRKPTARVGWKEFMRMKNATLSKGTVVLVNGVPFKLAGDVETEQSLEVLITVLNIKSKAYLENYMKNLKNLDSDQPFLRLKFTISTKTKSKLSNLNSSATLEAIPKPT